MYLHDLHNCWCLRHTDVSFSGANCANNSDRCRCNRTSGYLAQDVLYRERSEESWHSCLAEHAITQRWYGYLHFDVMYSHVFMKEYFIFCALYAIKGTFLNWSEPFSGIAIINILQILAWVFFVSFLSFKVMARWQRWERLGPFWHHCLNNTVCIPIHHRESY